MFLFAPISRLGVAASRQLCGVRANVEDPSLMRR
jgi:hypothetical protein